MSSQEEISRAWENIKLISNPAWVTKSDEYIKANQRLWSWKCAQECHDHLYALNKKIEQNKGENKLNNNNLYLRSVRDTIPQSRLAKYYGNFYYEESRECLYTENNNMLPQATSEPVTCSKDNATEYWMLPEVDYWYKMLTENDMNVSNQDTKKIINDAPICAQKVDTIHQITSQTSILTTNIYETLCLFNEKIFTVDPQEIVRQSTRNAKDIGHAPKWIIYLDQMYPDLQLMLRFIRKTPLMTFSLYSTQSCDRTEEIVCKLINKFPMEFTSDDEKKVYEKLLSSCVQNIWRCEYCSSKNCMEKSHATVKNPTFPFTPESIAALQKSILDFRMQIKNNYSSNIYPTQSYTRINGEPRKIKHDKRRFKNKVINKCKCLKETNLLEQNAIKPPINVSISVAENKSEGNCPNQILKEFFDHFRKAANNKTLATRNEMVSTCSSNAVETNITFASMLTKNTSQCSKSLKNDDSESDKTMKSVSSQTYSNEVANSRLNNRQQKINRNNQSKTNTKRKTTTERGGNLSKGSNYSTKTSSYSSTRNECYGSTSDLKKNSQGTFSNSNRPKGQQSKKKKRKTNQGSYNERIDKNNASTTKKITILNKSQICDTIKEEDKTINCPTSSTYEFDRTLFTENDLSAQIQQQHNIISTACGGEAFIQKYTLAQRAENQNLAFKEDPVLSFRKRLYSDVLSGNSSILLMNTEGCHTRTLGSIKLNENLFNKSQNTEMDFSPMVLLTSCAPTNVINVSSIEEQFEKLEIEALEQYKTSDESIDKKFDELEKEAIAQYVDTSDSYTSCKDEVDTSIKLLDVGDEGEKEQPEATTKKEITENEKTMTVNSFVIYSKTSGSRKSKNSKKSKTHNK